MWFRFGGVALYQCVVFDGAQGFVGADYDFLALGEAAEHLRVSGAGDAGGDGDKSGAELAFSLVDDIDALHGWGFGG